MRADDLMKELMNIEETAAYLGVKTGTLYHWISEARIPVIRLSVRAVRFRKSDLDKWLDELTSPCTDMPVLTGRSTSRSGRRFRP